jgi:sec-independent protein translocase protein TatA
MNYPLFIGGYEWLWIVVIVVVFLFGAKKVPELARAVGRARGEFERGKKELEGAISSPIDIEDKKTNVEDKSTKLNNAAQKLGISTEGKTDEQIKKEFQEYLKK